MARLRYHLPRMCLAGAAAFALLLVLAFRYAPTVVDRIGGWRKAAVERAVLDEWTVATAQPGTAAFAAYCESMAAVRSRDRMLPLAKEALRLSLATAVKAGDVRRALRMGKALVALDDHDLASLAQVGRVMTREPEQREQGLALLRRGAGAAPDHVLVVPVLFEALVDAALWEEAARVLLRAAAGVMDNRWEVRWSERVVDRAWVMPVDAGSGLRIATFSLVERPACLTIALPAKAAMVLRELGLWIADGQGKAVQCDPAVLVPSGLLQQGEQWIADGRQDAVLRAATVPFDGQGPWRVALRFRQEARLPDWLAASCLGEACGRLVRQEHALLAPLRDLRRRALAERRPQLAVVVDGRQVTITREVTMECRDAVTWSAEWCVPAGAQAVAVLPPALPGSSQRLDRVSVRVGESEDWQVVQVAERRVAGAPPHFEIAVSGPCLIRAAGELW